MEKKQIAQELRERRQAKVDDSPPLWKPYPGPQTLAQDSQADETLYGGAAGGGKSSLLVGLALTQHRKSVIYRREYPQLRAIIDYAVETVGSNAGLNQNTGLFRLPGRQIEFQSAQHEKDILKQQGRPRDLIGFDEAANFTRAQYRFLIGWNRSTTLGQRCRVMLASNPPTTVEGRWLIEEFAPWLDETYADPAAPGELRWYTILEGKLVWFREFTELIDPRNGSTIKTRSRTFIPASLDDNPALRDTTYRSVLQAMPEPLRSQLLYGDFKAGLEDDAWQVIPSAWVKAAMARWTEDGGADFPLDALGVDIARGGAAKTVLAKRRGPWLGKLMKHAGAATPDGQAVVQLILAALLPETHWERCSVNLDVISIGSSPYDLARQHEVKDTEPDSQIVRKLRVLPINFAAADERRDKAGLLRFANLRAFGHWHLRELLDPANGHDIALPNDPELLGDLCAAHWEMKPRGVTIQPKEEIEEALGRSPDCGDAAVYAFFPVNAAGIVAKQVEPKTAQQRHQAVKANFTARRNPFGRR